MPYARRIDANHRSIIEAFERLGCKVADVSRAGRGFPDIVVQWGGLTMLVEIKTKTGKLTDAQREFPLMSRVVRDLDGVQETVRVLRAWHAAIRQQGHTDTV